MAESSKVVDFGTNEKRVCNFLLLVNSKLGVDGITRVSSIKILGVTISCKLSMSDHVSNVIGGCSQILYALRVLRAYCIWNV